MRTCLHSFDRLASLVHRGAEADETPDRQRSFDFRQEQVSKARSAEAARGSGGHLPCSPDNKFRIDKLARHLDGCLSYAPNSFKASSNFSLGTTP